MSKNKDKKDILDDLNDRLEKEKERLAEAKKAEVVAKKLADTSKQVSQSKEKTDGILDQISEYTNAKKPRAGTIQRVLGPLGMASPVTPIAEANASGASPLSNKYLNIIAKKYAKQVRDVLATTFSGKNYSYGKKGGEDLAGQMGIQNKTAKMLTGLTLDIVTDPTNFIKWPAAALKVAKTVGNAGLEIASKSSKIEKGIETVKENFDIFYKIKKNRTAEEVKKFQQGFNEFSESGAAGYLESLGFDMRKYVKTKKGASTIDPSTKANYKYKGERTVTTETPEYTKALSDKEVLEKELSIAKADLKTLKTTGEPRTTLNDLWNKTTKTRDELQKANLDKIKTANDANKAVKLKGFADDVLEKYTSPEITKVEQEIARLEADLSKETARLATRRAKVDITKPATIDKAKVSETIENSSYRLNELNDDLNIVKQELDDANKSLALLDANRGIPVKWAEAHAEIRLQIDKLTTRRRSIDKQIIEESKSLKTNIEKIEPRSGKILEQNQQNLKNAQTDLIYIEHNLKQAQISRSAHITETPETATLDKQIANYTAGKIRLEKYIDTVKGRIEKAQEAVEKPIKDYLETVLDLRQFNPDDLLKLSTSDKYFKTTEKLEAARKKLAALKAQRGTTLNELWKQYTKSTEALDLPFASQSLDNLGKDSIAKLDLLASQIVTKSRVPKTQKLSGNIDLGSYNFTKYIANKNLTDLNPKEIAELKKMLEQWQKIAVKGSGSAGSWYKQFADEILPKLNDGSLTGGKTAEIAKTESKVIDIEAKIAAKTKEAENIRKANTKIQKGFDDYYDILDEAFGPAKEAGMLGKSLDFTSGLYKRIMSWNPIFQSRNFLGGVMQNVSEGRGLSAYANGYRYIRTKGASNQELYDYLKKNGVYEQPGMYEQPMSRFPGRVTAAAESLNRVTSILDDISKGFSKEDALDKSIKMYYKYNQANFTKFEKVFMKRLDPFYAYDKQNWSYFMEAIFDNSTFWNTAAKVKQATKTEDEKKNPYLERDYRQDQFSIGQWGNFGIQAEDAFKLFTLDWRSAYNKTAPLLQAVTEGTLDYNIFKDIQISKDTKAGSIEKLPEPLRKIYGYDDTTKTVDPTARYLIDKFTGGTSQYIQNVFDPTKSILSAATSVKPYKTDQQNLAQQYVMDKRKEQQGGFWYNNRFSDLLGISKPTSGAAVAIPYGDGTKTVLSKPSAEMMFNINTSMRASAKLAEALRMSGDLVQGSYKSMQQELGAERWYSKVTGEDPKAYKKREEAYINYQKKTLPRYINQPGYFSAWEFENIQPTMGMNKEQIAFNKLQENYNKMKAKLQSFQIAGYGDDKSAALEKRDHDRQEALKTVNAQYLGKDGKYTDPKKAKEELTKAYVGIERDFYTTISKIEGKSNKATASILKNWADATSNAYEKIEYNRQAAIKEYEGSDEYRSSVSNAEKIAAAKKAINAKYDKQRQDQIAEDAKATMESVKTMTEGNAKAIIAGLEAIYKRGGMTISDYYGKILDTHTKKAIEQAKAALKLIEASFQTTETGASANKGLSFDTPAISPYVKWAKDNRIGTDAEKGAVISINGKAVKVVDGDTFEFETEGGVNGSGKFNTRLYGFDAPETAKYDKNGTQVNPDQAYGKKAAEALKKAIEGQVVTLKVVAIDTYGRPVSVVSKGNENINKSMLKGGYGEAYKEYLNNPEYKDAFLAAEQEAKASKSGVWSLKNYERPTDFRARWRKSMMEKYTTSTASSMDSTERLLAADNIKYDVEASPGKTVSAEALKKALAQIDALYAKFQKTKNVESFLADVNGLKLQDQGITFNMKTNPETSLNDVASDAKAFIGNVLTSLGQQDMTYDQAVNELKAYAEKMRELGASVQGANINKKQLQEGIDALNKVATGLEEKTFEVQTAIQTENIKVIESIKETKDFLSKSKLSLFSEMPTSDFGITSTSSGLKWGKIRRPGKQYRPEDYDVEAEQKKATQETAAAPYASQMKKILTEQPGSFETKDWMMQAGESSLEYMTRLETAVQNHKLNLENMEQQSQDKLKRIQETAAQWQMQNTKTVQDFEIAAYAKKVQSYADMTSTLSAAASNFYEASGKKSKEWFYIMKAAALAEAMVKGYQAIMNAFTAGTSSGKGVTGGFAEVAVATAFVASQIALITSQMFAGPGKAKGGPITGGSGTKDDVPIMAMGGEYVIRKSSTEKYGTAFLDALNRGLIPVSDLKFSVPHIPEPMHYQTHFAEGGQVPVSTSKTPITVELKNESGTPLQQKKSDVSFDGQQYVVSVWLDALNRNAYGLRDSLGR